MILVSAYWRQDKIPTDRRSYAMNWTGQALIRNKASFTLRLVSFKFSDSKKIWSNRLFLFPGLISFFIDLLSVVRLMWSQELIRAKPCQPTWDQVKKVKWWKLKWICKIGWVSSVRLSITSLMASLTGYLQHETGVSCVMVKINISCMLYHFSSVRIGYYIIQLLS